MSIARIIWIISLLAAIVLAFVSAEQFAYGGAILTILGIVCGWFVDKEHRVGLLVAAIFLMSGGAMAWGGIPSIGGHLSAILGSISGVLAAAGVTAILRRLVERLFLNKGTAN